jgi:hypothetical protein
MDLNAYGNDYAFTALGMCDEADYTPKQNKFKELSNINKEIAIGEEKLRELNNNISKTEGFFNMGLKPAEPRPLSYDNPTGEVEKKSIFPQRITFSFEGMILMVLLIINVFIMIMVSRSMTPVVPYTSTLSRPLFPTQTPREELFSRT